jgi:hypothetical protein
MVNVPDCVRENEYRQEYVLEHGHRHARGQGHEHGHRHKHRNGHGMGKVQGKDMDTDRLLECTGTGMEKTPMPEPVWYLT